MRCCGRPCALLAWPRALVLTAAVAVVRRPPGGAGYKMRLAAVAWPSALVSGVDVLAMMAHFEISLPRLVVSVLLRLGGSVVVDYNKLVIIPGVRTARNRLSAAGLGRACLGNSRKLRAEWRGLCGNDGCSCASNSASGLAPRGLVLPVVLQQVHRVAEAKQPGNTRFLVRR
jgi:hypothetical protein